MCYSGFNFLGSVVQDLVTFNCWLKIANIMQCKVISSCFVMGTFVFQDSRETDPLIEGIVFWNIKHLHPFVRIAVYL